MQTQGIGADTASGAYDQFPHASSGLSDMDHQIIHVSMIRWYHKGRSKELPVIEQDCIQLKGLFGLSVDRH